MHRQSCFHLAKEKVLFTGDTILGASSATVSDLSEYMKTLDLLGRLRVDTICPAHGPVVPKPRGSRLVAWYTAHRNQREQQVLQSLEKGILDVEGIVKNIYPRNLKKDLRRGASGNVQHHLDKLKKEGQVQETAASYRLNA